MRRSNKWAIASVCCTVIGLWPFTVYCIFECFHERAIENVVLNAQAMVRTLLKGEQS